MPSFIRLSKFRGSLQNPAIMPICKIKNDLGLLFSHQQKKMLQWPTLTDNLWSNIRWQWWQLVVLGRWKRTTTWFHHWFSPRFCGRPVMSHFGNPFNSLSNFRLSIVWKHSSQNMIFTCTSKGNSLPNGLSFGLTNPLYFMLITPSMKVTPEPRSTLLIWFLEPIAYSRQDFFHGRKKCTHGGTPYSFLLSTSSPRDPSPPISSLGWLSKTRCAPTLSLIPHCPAKLFSMA